MKKVLSLILALSLAVGLVGCGGPKSTVSNNGGENSTNSTAETKPLKFAFFMFENSNTFTTYIRKGLEAYGKEHNVIVDSYDGKSDQSTQTDGITTALAKGQYDLIVVNPVDPGAASAINSLCKQYNVPVIYADRAPDLEGGALEDYEKAYYIGLDWSDPGYVQADMVYEDWKNHRQKMDKNGDGILQYVILQGNVAQQNAIFRCAAIDERFKGWAEDKSMVTERLDIQDGNWSSEKGKDIMDTWNVKFGDQIEAVLCNNDTMAMGAAESIKTTGKYEKNTAPYVYGINAIPDVWELIEGNYMRGSVLTSPYREAKAIIDIGINLCNDNDPLTGTSYKWGEFKKDIRIDDVAITSENLQVAQDDFAACM